jgi:Fe-S oxidoreductase
MQEIARATATILSRQPGRISASWARRRRTAETKIRRFGEEMFFQDHERDQIPRCHSQFSGVKHIITADPHAYNALKNDYTNAEMPPVEHISQFVARNVKSERRIKTEPANG